ncbi:MAG: Dabb family protein [Bacteroidota bacterium]
MKKIIILIFTLCFLSCRDTAVNQADTAMLDSLKEEILQLESELLKEKLDKDAFASNDLVHIVYFKMKEGLSSSQLAEAIATLESLKKIEEVKSLEVGDLDNTGDARAGSTEGLVLQMTFASKEDLASYQKNEFHLEQRVKLKDFFGGPPVVYDYFIK